MALVIESMLSYCMCFVFFFVHVVTVSAVFESKIIDDGPHSNPKVANGMIVCVFFVVAYFVFCFFFVKSTESLV